MEGHVAATFLRPTFFNPTCTFCSPKASDQKFDNRRIAIEKILEAIHLAKAMWSSWESNPEPSPTQDRSKSNAKKMSYH
ncbi:hypothetical protein KCU85_g460, partial [Aureobasidium melanogenum]